MTVRYYHQYNIYAGLSHGQVLGKLPPMLLTVTALVKIVNDGLTVSRGEIFGPYPYKYFIILLE